MEKLQAKVYGGADVLTSGSQPSVGTANIALALERLRHFGIPVTARRTRGKRGRLIGFHTGTGEVLVRAIPVSRVVHDAEHAA
jgi:chemotaxis protein CheD